MMTVDSPDYEPRGSHRRSLAFGFESFLIDLGFQSMLETNV